MTLALLFLALLLALALLVFWGLHRRLTSDRGRLGGLLRETSVK